MEAKTIIPTALFGMLLIALATGCHESTLTKTPERPDVQGRWSGFEHGTSQKFTIIFTNNQFTYFDAQNNEIGNGTFFMDESARPMKMDLTFERIPASDLVGKVGHAIFELNADELKIAGCEVGSDQRPTNIVGGQGVRVFIFKRQ